MYNPQTVKDLDAVNFRAVGATFKGLPETHPGATVNIHKYFAEEHDCGTVACIAGWYGFSKGIDNYRQGYAQGATKLARDLGFDDAMALADFFDKYPSIWGNKYGRLLCSSNVAYGVSVSKELTLDVVGDFYNAVADRIDIEKERIGCL